MTTGAGHFLRPCAYCNAAHFVYSSDVREKALEGRDFRHLNMTKNMTAILFHF